jgi:hypothetical protein
VDHGRDAEQGSDEQHPGAEPDERLAGEAPEEPSGQPGIGPQSGI